MKLLEDRCLEPDVFDGWPLDLVLGAPATFERILELTMREELGSSFVARKLSSWAKDILSEKRRRSLLARLPGEVAAGVMRRQLRKLFGGEETRLVCAGMTPTQELQRVYREAGFPLLSGYGLTESSGFTHLNPPDESSLTTVGPTLEGVGSRISPQGEILVKGRTVFAGYWREDDEPQSGREVDGWWSTGDVGVEEESGLVVLGRKQHLFETASGHPVAPLPLEADLEAHDGVKHAVVVGEGRPYVSAILELETSPNGSSKGGEVSSDERELGKRGEREREVRRLVDEINTKLPRQERIRAFRVVGSLMPDGEEGGALGRPRREVVLRSHAQLIEEMYSPKESSPG